MKKTEFGLDHILYMYIKTINFNISFCIRVYNSTLVNISIHRCTYSIQGMVEWGRVVTMIHE